MGFLRLLIIVILFYLIYQVLKGWGGKKNEPRKPNVKTTNDSDLEELVQDAQTGVYFPRSKGVAALIEGRVYYFLNNKNRDIYLESKSSSRSGGTK